MKKTKIFLLILSLVFLGLFVGGKIVNADDCRPPSQCFEVTSISSSGEPQVTGSLAGLNFTDAEKNLLKNRENKIAQNNVYLCSFNQTDRGDDIDGWAVCDKVVKSDGGIYYKCYLDEGSKQLLEGYTKNSDGSCSYNDQSVECKYVEGSTSKITEIEGCGKSGTSSSYSPSSSSSSGTCNIDCKVGGFFKNTPKKCICCGMCTPDDLLTVANTALKWLFGIVGALGLAMFVYGGFLWIVSRGESGQISKGKDVIKNTVLGMIIMFASGTMILALQKALKVDSSAQVNIIGETSFDGSSGSGGASDKTAEHGDKKVGEACKVLAGEDSECEDKHYCYSTSNTKGASGVCVPLTSNRGNVADGGDCYYMSHTDNPSMCKEGQCITGKSNPAVGDKGECKKPNTDSSTNLPIGSECTRLPGSESQCASGMECWNASGTVNTLGTCLPESGRNRDYGESCYLLLGKNDCKSPYYCITDGMLSGWTGGSKTAFRGKAGRCLYNYHTRDEGQSCKENFECKSGICSSGACQ